MVSLFLLLILMAPTQLDEDPDFARGRDLYRDLEFEQAVFRFQAVALKPSLKAEEKAEAFLWLGLCYAGVPDNDLALQAFRDALRLDPAAKLPVENPPPSVLDLFLRAKASVKPAAGPTAPAADPLATPEPAEGPGPEAGDAQPTEDRVPLFQLGLVGLGAGGLALAVAAVTGGAGLAAYGAAFALRGAPDTSASTVNQLVTASWVLGGIAGVAIPVALAAGAAGAAVLVFEMQAAE